MADEPRSPGRFDHLDRMSTETLEEILRQDSLLPADEAPTEEVLHITEVLAARRKENGTLPDADAAWRRFAAHDLPQTGETASPEDPVDRDVRSRSPRCRAALLAAVLAALLLAGAATAHALGFRVFKTIAEWTSEEFRFSSNSKLRRIPEVLDPLRKSMEDYGLSADLLPTYLPEGYTLTELQTDPMWGYTTFCCLLQKDQASLMFTYRLYDELYDDENTSGSYQKDAGAPEVYTHKGTDYYIMTNWGRYYAVWIDGAVEGSVSGLATREELIKIIDSI